MDSNFVHNQSGPHSQSHSHGYATVSPTSGHKASSRSLKRTLSDFSIMAMMSASKYAKLSGLLDQCMDSLSRPIPRSNPTCPVKYGENSSLPYDGNLKVPSASTGSGNVCVGNLQAASITCEMEMPTINGPEVSRSYFSHNELMTQRESLNSHYLNVYSPYLQKVNEAETEMVDIGSSLRLSQSSFKGCPECAAGKPGHIRHIGRWRLMDTA